MVTSAVEATLVSSGSSCLTVLECFNRFLHLVVGSRRNSVLLYGKNGYKQDIYNIPVKEYYIDTYERYT
jgi:hypothetical protein